MAYRHPSKTNAKMACSETAHQARGTSGGTIRLWLCLRARGLIVGRSVFGQSENSHPNSPQLASKSE